MGGGNGTPNHPLSPVWVVGGGICARVSRWSSFSLCRECCGALEYYDKAFDRITTRNEKLLRSIKRIFHTVTTTDDPVIRKVRSLVRQTQCRFPSVGEEIHDLVCQDFRSWLEKGRGCWLVLLKHRVFLLLYP